MKYFTEASPIWLWYNEHANL